MNYLHNLYLNNPLSAWLTTILILVGGFVLLRIFKLHLIRKLKKWTSASVTSLDDFFIAAGESLGIPFLYVLVVYIALSSLVLPPSVAKGVGVSFFIVSVFFILLFINRLLNYFVCSWLNKREDSDIRFRQAKGLMAILKVLVWVTGTIFLLDNFGYNVSTLIAGLGIGGIAIALAAQTILADLFSYFVILFDRPFQIGDFILVDDKMGVVEYIGIKTTRLRTLGGEQLICSNKDLTDSRVHNVKRMEQRRVVFNLAVTYQTPATQLEQIPRMVKGIITQQPNVKFDRGHFSTFGNSSLNFEFVYYVMSSDYTVFMDTQQNINLEIFRVFESNGIDFAHPTQTLFVNHRPIRIH